MYLILNAFIDMIHGSFPKEGKSLFYLHRGWLHSKGADAGLSSGLKASDKPHPHRRRSVLLTAFICTQTSSSPVFGLSWWALQKQKLSFEWCCIALILPEEQMEMDIPGLAFALFLMARSAEATLYPIYQSCRRKLRAVWRAERAEQPMPSFSCRRHTHTSKSC